MVGYFLIVDFLGFRSTVKDLEDLELHTRIEKWASLVKRAAITANVEKYSLLSDTVFAATEASENGLRSLIKMSRILLNDGIKLSLPIRGAISHGRFTWGKLTYGKAVIDAQELESQQNWVGIACTDSLPHIDAFWDYDLLISYPVPKKSGKVDFLPAVTWETPDFESLCNYLTGTKLDKFEDKIDVLKLDIINNTILFSVYIRLMSVTKSPVNSPIEKASEYLPVRLIEKIVTSPTKKNLT